jgi:hypothetical protein
MPSSLDRLDAVNQGLTKRWRAHERDEHEASILGAVLAQHPAFRAKAAHLAPIADDEQRAAAAYEDARAYVAKASPGRDVIARLLLRAADGTIGVADGTAVWADDERSSEMRRQRVRDRLDLLTVGARRVARRGASECIECGAHLQRGHERVGSSHRRRRRLYCGRHEQMESGWAAGVHAHEIKSAIEAATGQHRQRLHRRHGTSLAQ